MNNKLLIIYNCCGIRSSENYYHYLESVNSFFRQQNFVDYDITLSGCLLSGLAKQFLIENLQGKVNLNFIDEKHPVNVTLNHSVLETVNRNGKYYGYMYVDSGTNMDLCPDGLAKLWELVKTDEYGMVSPQPQNDTEYFNGLGVGNHYADDENARKILFENGNYIIPVGKAFATHNNIVHHRLYNQYNRMYPDIFAGHCTESVFSFMNAALGMKWVLVKDVMFSHHRSLDGPSSGFHPGIHQHTTGKPTWEHPYIIPSIVERIKPGMQYGMGYEECRQICIHNPDNYDSYFCKNEQLKDYIRDNLFLQPNELNYDKIVSTYIEQ